MVKKSILKDKPEILIKRYRGVLKNAGIPVIKMIIFGSYANGTAKPWSDLDVCVVSKKFGKNDYDETVLLGHLTTGVDSMIEPHPYNPKDLDNPFDPLAFEIKRTGREV